MDKYTAIQTAIKYVELLKKHKFDVIKAYLFGSYARENYSGNSDIDVAVALRNIENRFNAQVSMLKLAANFDTRIEPHPFEESDLLSGNPFIEEIVSNGVSLPIH